MKAKHFYFDRKKMMIKLVTLIVLILILFGFWLFNRPKNCSSDETCFNSNFIKCNKAYVVLSDKENNKFNFEIKGHTGNNCIVEAELVSMAESKPLDIRNSLEGKSMTCSIPKDNPSSINNIENLNDYCTGQLKEASLQITIEKMYSIIVQNIGPLATEFRNVLKSPS